MQSKPRPARSDYLCGHARQTASDDSVARFASNSDFIDIRKFLTRLFIAGAVLAGMAGCAQVKKPVTQARAATVGSRFDQVGRVTLFAGEPCTPQIMFGFHGAASTVWLATPMHETKILTDAAKKDQRVHISGKWRRGGESNCRYVEVTNVEL